MMEITTTEKGNRKVLRERYLYVFKKNLTNDITSWECELRRKGECRASIKLGALDIFVGQMHEHTHPPSQAKCGLTNLKAGIKRRATNSSDTKRQILATEAVNIPQTVAVNMPLTDSIRRNIRLQRQNRQQYPNPIAREAVPELPAEYRQTATGEQFLIHDSGVGDENRILIFGSVQALELLGQSLHWFSDGTFKVCPEIFYQLYTLHALINERVIPCIYALLPNKTEETYHRFFSEVAVVLQQYVPSDIMMDFELASINASSVNFPGVEMKGCFYHLSSNLWKRIQRLGLQQR